ncbi:MAG: anti-sigma factor antagonist [Oligoflexia bacterium]|nr:anti-sigma factor antagonist [Oligoflexia bacterium]
MNKQPNTGLEYSISENNDHFIVNFKGIMAEKTTHVINECQKDLNKLNAKEKYVILNFNSVVALNEEIVGTLRGLQSAIRKRPAKIRVCCLRPEWKKIFSENDVFHKDEFGEGLESTLDGLSKRI